MSSHVCGLEDVSPLPRVLSVQSSVVSGYVGNRSAMFPLQLLGFDVDCVNSVQFSNHTGYPLVKGTVLSGSELNSLSQGLESNKLLTYDYLLTGYIGSDTFLAEVLTLLDMMEKNYPGTRYICDPVLGDNGKYYVPESLVELFRDRVIPRAYMVTPNHFEASVLTGIAITSEPDLLRAMKQLLRMGPRVVVITSSELTEFPGLLGCYSMSTSENDRSVVEVSRIVVEKIDSIATNFTGTGDCSAALLLGWSHLLSSTPSSPSSSGVGYELKDGMTKLGLALLNTIESVQAMLRRTQSKQNRNMASKTYSDLQEASKNENEKTAFQAKATELCLIESRFDIMNPPRNIKPINGISSGSPLASWIEDIGD